MNVENLKSTGCLCFSTIGFLLGAAIFGANWAQADDFDSLNFSAAQWVEYERELNAILKTRRDQEKVFVHEIVEKVRLGKIPYKLVATSFQWGRNKRPNTNFPFIYFEHVIRLQAKKLKLQDEIPPFDYSIYRSAGQATNGQFLNAGQKTKIQEASGKNRSAGQRR